MIKAKKKSMMKKIKTKVIQSFGDLLQKSVEEWVLPGLELMVNLLLSFLLINSICISTLIYLILIGDLEWLQFAPVNLEAAQILLNENDGKNVTPYMC